MPSAISKVISYACLLGLITLILGAAPASAHASLVRSNPSDGASIATAPGSISFTFNEDISEPAYVAVRAPDGTAVELSGLSVTGAVVTATLVASDQRGRFTASYRVVSTDGHPVEGDIRFTATTGRKVTQVEPPGESTFLHRHSAHLFWGILAAAVLIGLLLTPLRRRDDQGDA